MYAESFLSRNPANSYHRMKPGRGSLRGKKQSSKQVLPSQSVLPLVQEAFLLLSINNFSNGVSIVKPNSFQSRSQGISRLSSRFILKVKSFLGRQTRTREKYLELEE